VSGLLFFNFKKAARTPTNQPINQSNKQPSRPPKMQKPLVAWRIMMGGHQLILKQ
jgi:hypothetical protein